MKSKKNLVQLVPILVLVFFVTVVCTGILPAQTVVKDETGADEKVLAEGNKLLDKVITAMGGAETISKVKNYGISMRFVRVMDTEIMEMDSIGIVEFPDKVLYVVWNRRGAFIMAADGDKGWRRNPPGPLEQMNADFVAARMLSIKRDFIYICNNRHEYNFRMVGEKDYYGKKVIDLHITGPVDYHQYIDPETYLPVGGSFEAMTSSSPKPVLQEEFYYDYKNIGGINWFSRCFLRAFGALNSGSMVKEVKINLKFDKDFFKGTLNETYERIREGKWDEH